MFYEFNQNNTGGRFDFDEEAGITHWVIVEADSESEAVRKAEEIGLYWDGCDAGMDCPCCGDRWSNYYINDSEKPEIYGEPLTKNTFKKRGLNTWMDEGREACVHFKDGTKAWY
jgi:hypothetical protein